MKFGVMYGNAGSNNKNMNALLEHALKYAALGWHVFPLKPNQKVPITAHGVKDATLDEAHIRYWWKQWPDANIGLACGPDSGVYVIDIDVNAEKGIDGFESMKEFPKLPKTVTQETPRGGCHAFYKTDNPPINKNNFRPGVDIRAKGYYVLLPPSIHPNGGVYEWAPGFSPGEQELTEYPDFMRSAPKLVPTFKGVPLAYDPSLKTETTELYVTGVLPDADKLKRASLYLGQMDPAIEDSGGHSSLLRAAIAMVHGFLLTNGQAADLLVKEYNPRCVPPWNLDDSKDRKEFIRKIAEARKLTPEKGPGWLLQDDSYAPIDPAQVMNKEDIIELIANSEKKALDKSFEAFAGKQPKDKKGVGIPYFIQKHTGNLDCLGDLPAIDAELEFLIRPTGLLGEICDWINDTAIREQPILTLACALTFCGVLFGRKVRDSLGTRTNLYCMGIAKSSAGKAHAPNQIRKLAHTAGCGKLIGGDDVASDTAIEERLEKSPACLFLWDEIGFLLSHIRSGISQHHARIIPQLMKLWSSAGSVFTGKEYADSEVQRTIVQPCCCIYGTSTPTQFSPGISPEQLQDGWLARCFIFRTHSKPSKDRDGCDVAVPESISKQVAAWHARQIGETDGHSIDAFAVYHGAVGTTTVTPPEQIVVPRTSEAEEIFIAFERESTAFGTANSLLDCLWAKAEENARKIALILAASENFDSPRISLLNADYACRLVRYLLLDFGKHTVSTIVGGPIEAQKQKLLTVISKRGIDGCSNRCLIQRARWSTSKQRSILLADLIGAEEIVAQIKEGKRVPTFWTVENYQKYLEKQNES